jgi:hypothetical protein
MKDQKNDGGLVSACIDGCVTLLTDDDLVVQRGHALHAFTERWARTP